MSFQSFDFEGTIASISYFHYNMTSLAVLPPVPLHCLQPSHSVRQKGKECLNAKRSVCSMRTEA